MNHKYFDIVIVGTGLVGLATAHSIIKDFKDLRLAIIEKEKEICIHQSQRNSGVIHSGLYYKPGSERAINCTIGREMLIKYCKENKVEHDICGKIVVATNKNELERLYKLEINGKQNLQSGVVETLEDHRIAMTAVVANICIDSQIKADNIDCISDSYPDFFYDLEKIGANYES